MKSAVSDDFTKSIDEAVHKVRKHQDIKGRYMTLQEKFDDEKVAGIREGIETGKAEGESSKAKEIYMNLLRKCLDIDMISDVTGLMKKEISQISKV